MRKAFNFYQSHWEQIKLLNDKQKLDLFNAICSVQFLEVNIDDVTFKDQISTLVWTGIKHSISTSLSGFITKNKSLDKEVNLPLAKGGAKAPCQQEEEKEEEKEKEEEQVEYTIAEKTIMYLNKVANKKYSFTKGNLKEINAQVNKLKKLGDTLDIIEKKFAYVIDVKTKEWINNKEMNKNLNPVTLFRESNFDRYLNQNTVLTRDEMIDAVFDELERRNG